MDLTGHVQLLLGTPGQAAPALPAAPWRLAAVSEHGVTDPAALAGAARLSPVASRAEKALVAAVAADDVTALAQLATKPGAAQEAARVLYAGRLVGVDTAQAAEVLIAVLSAPTDPAAVKLLHRHWAELHVVVTLAPGVAALAPLSRVVVGLLLAEVCSIEGRPLDAVAVLRQLPPLPPVVLALAAALLAAGEHAQVLEVTSRVENGDDVSALTLVARSVAARTTGDLARAMDAASGALVETGRSRAVLAAALEERARVLAQAGSEEAARADLEALAALVAGTAEVHIPPTVALAVGRRGPIEEDDELHRRARDRMRRRIMGVGAPGTFGGRHHSTYRDEVAEMFSLGQVDAAEELLLGLLDAVEDEVAETGVELDPTFFLTLADLYSDNGRSEDLEALQERFEAAKARSQLTTAAPAAGQDDPAGERRIVPAPFDAPPPSDLDAVSIDGRPVDVDAAVEHLLVSVGVAPARRGEAGEQPTRPLPAPTPAPAPARPPDPPVATGAPVAPTPPVEPQAEPVVEPAIEPDPEVAGAPDEARSAPAEPAAPAVEEARDDEAPEAPAPEATTADPAGVDTDPVEAPAAEDPVSAPEAPEPPAATQDRPMTPLERAARGPRIRSL